jgi:GDP-mannose transporter
MTYLPYPAVVSFIQIVFAVIAVFGMKLFGIHVDDFEWSKVKPYMIYTVAFVFSIYANMKALSHSNVETVIVFRACSPISVTIIEYLLMDRQLPNFRSAMSLLVVVAGAFYYCITDSQLLFDGFSAYYWVFIYFLLITFEMTYGKQITSSVQLNVLGSVLYTNSLAAVPMFLLGFSNGEYANLGTSLSELPIQGVLVLLFSCIAGTLIGYTGWLCRGMVSATTYTLVGVVNKFFTVLLNVYIWDKHSTSTGIAAVCVCLLAGTFYQQAPKREDIKKLSNGENAV